MRLTDEEAVKAVEHDIRCHSEAYQNDRIQMLEACLKSTVRELLITLEEDSSDKAVEDYISDWFMYADEESRQYDHIGR